MKRLTLIAALALFMLAACVTRGSGALERSRASNSNSQREMSNEFR